MKYERENRLAAELATLKRQHEQLRAAAEPVRELLRMLALQYAYMHKIEMQPLYANLDAALDATPAEPVRELAKRYLAKAERRHVLQCHGYADCTAEQRANGCPECLRT